MGQINEWLDDFQMMGVKLNDGEKTLMRMAVRKENQRIMEVLQGLEKTTFPGDVWHINPFRYAIDIINQETT